MRTNEQQHAFPSTEPCEPPEISGYMAHKGMTLRDYFAAKALSGFCANPSEETCALDKDKVSLWAYEHADAMLKAREL